MGMSFATGFPRFVITIPSSSTSSSSAKQRALNSAAPISLMVT